MSGLTSEQISAALAGVVVPKVEKSLVELGVVRDVIVKEGDVKLLLQFNIAAYASKSDVRDWATQAVSALPGVRSVQTEFVASDASQMRKQAPSAKRRAVQLPQVACILAVFSGKGGVGKSTVSANLAVALASLGEQVGLFDADLHGPSIPKIMGLMDRPRMEENKMVPLERHGVKTMSVGFLVEETEPLIWRGPMITKGINELLQTTDWGPLDFLILDMPPGTGDAPLGLAQDVRLDGSIAVTTPQDVALADVRRGIAAFRKLEVPVWGMVENMAYLRCPHCDHTIEVFGSGNVDKESQAQGIPVLGRLPLDPLLSQASDQGVPIVSAQPEHPVSLEFIRIAEEIIQLV